MSLIEGSQRQLARDGANSPKVAALFFIVAGGWLVLDQAGVQDLASPWSAGPLLPLALIYVAERLGKLHWFRGMTLPSLCVMAGLTAMIWVLNAKRPLPSVFAYTVAVGMVAACGFLIFRIWTFDPVKRQGH
jgi:hypothetical protein